MNANQIEDLAQTLASEVLKAWKASQLATLKIDEKKVLAAMAQGIRENYQAEMQIEREAEAHIQKLQQTHEGEFQRGKMFQMIKQKLAKDKGFVL